MIYQDVFALPLPWLGELDCSLADTVERWAQQELIPKRHELGEDYQLLLRPALEKLFVEIGLQKLIWPEDQGGAGLDGAQSALAVCAVLEQIGRADVGIGLLLSSTLAVQSSCGIAEQHDAELFKRFSPFFCNDQASIAALILPDYSIDDRASGDFHGLPYQLRTRCENDEWILDGEEVRALCSGFDAALFGVVCLLDGKPGMLLVPADSDGLTRGDQLLTTGLAASRDCELCFDNVRVPKGNLVFADEEQLVLLLARQMLGSAATSAGAGLACYEILKEWGETRVIKGRGCVFKDNPLTAALMGRIGGKICTARLQAYSLAKLIADPMSFGLNAAEHLLANATAVASSICSSTIEALDHTMELMASAGYASEWQLERYWRDIKTLQSRLGPLPQREASMARGFFGSAGV
ncbi:MAG: acyl-CoA dehydrogenase family protein [Candidatus Alcyoniella australis]|nr:acyl-CoA dehydrogenase family protein [Candidatus Alcyoniella australis]